MRRALTLALVGGAAATGGLGLVADQDCQKEYLAFLTAYPEKKPSPEGYANFCSNLKVIEKHNSANARWSMGVNEFSDWTDDEKKVLLGWDMTDNEANRIPRMTSDELAAVVDWRSKMPAVKKQGKCGSCWAFSAIAVVDFFGGSHSEEELVDCYHGGEKGDNVASALQYLSQKGVASESGYKYTAGSSGKAGKCRHDFTPVAKVSNVQVVYGASSIASALQHQVVSICFSLSGQGSPFMNYHNGVYDQQCGTGAGHCVAAVGYASDYWIIRNSWGNQWGQNGHIYFKKGSNLCGMESQGTIAKVSRSPAPGPPAPPSPPSPPAPPSPVPSECGTCRVCFNPTNQKCQADGAHSPKTKAACEAKGHVWCGPSASEVYV